MWKCWLVEQIQLVGACEAHHVSFGVTLYAMRMTIQKADQTDACLWV